MESEPPKLQGVIAVSTQDGLLKVLAHIEFA